MRGDYWSPYVPVAVRRAKAKKKMLQLQKKGRKIMPVEIEGRKIAKTFWGAGWCNHLESFGDYANRIPRGRSYVRNGSVCHLDIHKGKVDAMVSGSSIYKINIRIKPLVSKAWTQVKKKCAGQVGSLLELLQGKLSESVMTVVTDKKTGLFPSPREIDFDCNCPDYAVMCKHVAAVLYGVGARLDTQPELLFKLRGVDHQELISVDAGIATAGNTRGKGRRIADDSLADVFGIELSEITPKAKRPTQKKVAKKRVKPAAKKLPKRSAKTAKKKTSARKKSSARAKKADLELTAKSVTALRKKFGMSPIEFALLVGVSTLSITNWEQKNGLLNLRKSSRESLQAVNQLSKRAAWEELTDI
ncbi:MAG: SWIM zinc finger family protein [Verrucomicrobia bacterium]|nr:SWIM zinc finger family protein [Verrucomicrobiota bacterium]